MKRTPLKNSRSKPRPGRVKGKEMTALREAAWERDGGLCCFCGLPVSFEEGHLAHDRGKRNHGDSLNNIKGPAHWLCHHNSHQSKGIPKAEWRQNL